jgi:ankyrin repeat protein
MTLQLSYFILLGGFSVLFGFLAFSPNSWPPKWRHLRKRVWLVCFAMWLVSAGILLADFLRSAPFFSAVRSGNLKRVEQLLAENPKLIQAKTIGIWKDDTALILAANDGNNAMVEFLLKTGADVNAADSANITPLLGAASYGNTSVVETLLKAGANVNASGFRHNYTALHIAAERGDLDIVKLLLLHGADRNVENMFHETPLQLAYEQHQTNVIAVLSDPNLPKK